MIQALLVGFGGFCGAITRYSCGHILYEGDFPLITFLINLVGSFIIGVVVGLAKSPANDTGIFGKNALLFLQTGFCGGFTTFSSFSLETVNLLKRGKYLTGSSYAVLSVLVCVAGAALGLAFAQMISARMHA